LIIREITPKDYPKFETFLYHAIFVPQGEIPPSRDLIYEPELYVYIDHFGDKPGDYRLTSLSVQKANPAVNFYKQLGYAIVNETAEEFLMVKEI